MVQFVASPATESVLLEPSSYFLSNSGFSLEIWRLKGTGFFKSIAISFIKLLEYLQICLPYLPFLGGVKLQINSRNQQRQPNCRKR